MTTSRRVLLAVAVLIAFALAALMVHQFSTNIWLHIIVGTLLGWALVMVPTITYLTRPLTPAKV